MSESLCFHDMSRLDIYEYSPVFNDTDPWAVIRTHTSANKHVSVPSYPKSDARSKRWSYESSASTDSSSSDTCSMPSFPLQEPTSKRSSIIYKPSNPDDRKKKARSSIVYKKNVPSSPCGAVTPSYPDLTHPSTSTPRTREKKLVTTLALAAWACTVGAVLSRRKMAARRRSLHLKPLQLPAQASLTQERAAFCWKVVAAHVQTPKARPKSIHFKPLVLPVQLNDSTECPLLSPSDLRRLLSAVSNRGVRGLISVARTLVFSVYLASTCCFRVPQFFLSLLSSVLLALIRRILPLRLL